MKETRADIDAQFEESKRKLAELETCGVEALSRHDVEIASDGDAQ